MQNYYPFKNKTITDFRSFAYKIKAKPREVTPLFQRRYYL